MSLSMYSGNSFEEINTATEVPLKWWIIAFGACWHIFLTNLMIAHFCESYRGIFQDAMGHAWLTRGTLILETAMPLVSLKNWKGFVESLKLEEPCELDEGDVGPRGGVATAEGPFEPWPHIVVDLKEKDFLNRCGWLETGYNPKPYVQTLRALNHPKPQTQSVPKGAPQAKREK